MKAAEDERALDAPENSDTIVGFHAQQAVEKLMKVLLSARNLSFEFTHNLERLQVALEAAGEKLPQTPVQLDQLTDYAVVYRYDLVFLIAPPDRAQLAETVRLIREHVTIPHRRPLRSAPVPSATIDKSTRPPSAWNPW